MEYITAAEAAVKWGVSLRQIQRLLAANRIPGAKSYGRSWLIPGDAQKPCDARREKKTPHYDLASDLADIIDATTAPWPRENPYKILDTIQEERIRLHYEDELIYLKGDFELVKSYFYKTDGDDASRLRACPGAIASAISMGDYPFYLEIEDFLKSVIQSVKDENVIVFAELCLSTAYTGAVAPNMVPDWLKSGDFSHVHPRAKRDAAYKRAKYFECISQFELMLATAQTALTFCDSDSGISTYDIYFRVVCAMACCLLNRMDEGRRWLLDAMRIAMPHGFITPFAESAHTFGGLLEQILERDYPEYYNPVIEQWKRTIANWVTFHNSFTRANATRILSLREYQIAQQAALGASNAEIADKYHIAEGTVKNRLNEIYGKLYISNRNDLKKLIM